MTTTHYIGDGCPGGHRDPAELVDHLNRELAAIDIPAVAKRLSGNQRRVLFAVARSAVHRSPWADICRQSGCMAVVTRTVESLVRRDLVWPPDPGETVALTELGRAVLDHLTEQDRVKRREQEHRWS